MKYEIWCMKYKVQSMTFFMKCKVWSMKHDPGSMRHNDKVWSMKYEAWNIEYGSCKKKSELWSRKHEVWSIKHYENYHFGSKDNLGPKQLSWFPKVSCQKDFWPKKILMQKLKIGSVAIEIYSTPGGWYLLPGQMS